MSGSSPLKTGGDNRAANSMDAVDYSVAEVRIERLSRWLRAMQTNDAQAGGDEQRQD